MKEFVERNFGSDKKFSDYLGVFEGTAERYRLVQSSLPMSLFEKLRCLEPTLRATKITDSSWGQRKGAAVLWQKRKRVTVDSLLSNDVDVYDQLSPSKIVEIALDTTHIPGLAEFVGRILGDGSPTVAPAYHASEIESQTRMQNLVYELFGYRPTIGIAKGNYRIQLKRLCGHTLELLGIPLGRKSVTNPPVPNFIMKSSVSAVWLSFLRGLFDDEAYVSERGIEIGLAVRQIDGYNNLVESRILNDVSELLCRLGIQHVRRRGQTYRVGGMRSICWFLRIPRREFKKAQEFQLFLLPEKEMKLAAALASAYHERT